MLNPDIVAVRDLCGQVPDLGIHGINRSDQNYIAKLNAISPILREPWDKFRDTRFEPLQLAGADLSGIDLTGANLDDADLRNANLSNTRAHFISLKKANMEGANLSGAKWIKPEFDNVKMNNADLTGARFDLVLGFSGDWSNAILERTTLGLLCFSKGAAIFKGAMFKQCTVIGCSTQFYKHAKAELISCLDDNQAKEITFIDPVSKGSPCFIATACFPHKETWELTTLRSLRDEVLTQCEYGIKFIHIYNNIGPRIACKIRGSRLYEAAARNILVRPFAYVSHIILKLVRMYRRNH